MIGWAARVIPIALVVFSLAHGTEQGQKIMVKVKNVFLEFQAGMELSGIARNLRPGLVVDGDLPVNFRQYVRENMQGSRKDTSLDPWNRPYGLKKKNGRIIVYSCGPDQNCGSKDDIESIVGKQKRR
jgi:hypothetical protein